MGVWHSIRCMSSTWVDFAKLYLVGLRNGFDRAFFSAQIPIWANRTLRTAGVALQVEGREHVGPGPYLIASNHQGNLDIPALAAAFDNLHTVFVMKHELTKVPVAGRLLLAAGNIPINRGDRGQALAAIEAALRQLRQGEGVIMFPEGTRTKTGRMGRVRKGVFYFSIHTGMPILPVAITGSFERFPKDRFLSINPGPLKVQILAPIAPDPARDDDQAGDLMERWERAVKQAIGELAPAIGETSSI